MTNWVMTRWGYNGMCVCNTHTHTHIYIYIYIYLCVYHLLLLLQFVKGRQEGGETVFIVQPFPVCGGERFLPKK